MLIGLTGGIATGKSTVSGLLQNMGAIIVDADEVSRDVVAPNSEGLSALVEVFGSGILTADGQLNRTQLGTLVFSSPDKRKALERILHPLIARESTARIAAALSENPPWVIYDAALLIESGRAADFRPLIVVTTDSQTQCHRLMKRDGLSRDEAMARINAQMPLEEKARHGDYVLENSGPVHETESQLKAILLQIEASK